MANYTITAAQLTELYNMIAHKSGLLRAQELDRWMSEVVE